MELILIIKEEKKHKGLKFLFSLFLLLSISVQTFLFGISSDLT